jgi:hypothetical protein
MGPRKICALFIGNEKPLGKIGSASRRSVRCEWLSLRRFRFAGEKEAAGVCRECGESMEIQLELTDKQ